MDSISKRKNRWVGWLLVIATATFATGCAGGGAPGPYAASQPNAKSSPTYAAESGGGYQPGTAGQRPEAPPAPPPATAAPHGGADKSGRASEAAPRDDRPGLATQWGETRRSEIRTTTFFRASDDQPSALTTLWYNDREGSRAQASAEGYRSFERASVAVAEGGVTISLKDEGGRTLPGYFAGGKTFAIGEAGTRYTIVLTNHTPARFEAVVSVDGLDVIDGRPAGFGKRGYLINPHASLEVDGFRQSESTVAAFRFGSVRSSYAAKKGDDRNVGVIGVAIFHERGTQMWPWDPREVDRRREADPFPNRFATPPLVSWWAFVRMSLKT
jgi:hypothetical protein